jgi:hypothetical protein
MDLSDIKLWVPSQRDWTTFYMNMVRAEVAEGAKYILSALQADKLAHLSDDKATK